jgi:hypothetical protein
MLRIERLVLARDGIEPGSNRRAGLGNPFPLLRPLSCFRRLCTASVALRPGNVATVSFLAPRTASRVEYGS